jgi:hypothetical protein
VERYNPMQKLKRKLDERRRDLDNLILDFAKERNARMHEWQTNIPERIESSMERIQKALHELFMATIALGD